MRGARAGTDDDGDAGVHLLAPLLVLTVAGCSLYFEEPDSGGGGGTGAVDGGAGPIDPDRCPPHTATIFEPPDDATVPRTFTARVRWNEPGIPDRYSSMSDDYGNYFITTGPGEVLGDGSIRVTYTLPAEGHFTFEIGWYCDAANDGPRIPLARHRLHTLSN